jgi:hypothetical protein
MLAAFLVLGVVSGRQGVVDLWRKMIRWRVGWLWYVLAPGFLLVAHLSALAISLSLGAQLLQPTHLQSPSAYLGLLFPFLLLGGQWEEPGWLGYALQRLQGRFLSSPLIASLTVGLFRMIWHTPLLLAGAIPWYDYLFVSFALQFIFTWLYNRTNNSVLIPMIGHFFSNFLFAIFYPLFGGAEQERYFILVVAMECVIALTIVLVTRGRMGLNNE